MQQLIEEVPQDVLIINSFPRMWREMVYFTEEYFVKLGVQMELKINSVISPSPSLAPGRQIRTLNNAQQPLPLEASFGLRLYNHGKQEP